MADRFTSAAAISEYERGGTVAKADEGLLSQLEAGALDSSQSLADTLRKCISLGGWAGSEELRDWARRELDGYGVDDELPTYRVLPAALKVDGTTFNAMITGQPLSSYDLPDFAREHITNQVEMRQGIAELELMAKSDSDVKLQHPGMQDLVAYMNGQQAGNGSTITTMYWLMGVAAIHGAVDAIRTNLVALVAEMRAAGIPDGAIPSADVAERAVQVVIHGAKRSPITVNAAVAAGGASADASFGSNLAAQSRIPAWVRGPWGLVVGLSTIVAAYTGIAAATGWPPF